MNPIVFSMCGHGNYTTTSVECTKILMKVGDTNVAKMKDRVLHLNSCETGGQLGPTLMSAGALAFVGSNESFWFYTGDVTRTLHVQCAVHFSPSGSLMFRFCRGKMLVKPERTCCEKYDDELTYWVEGDGKTHPDASEIARIININKSISTYLGEPATQPSPSGGGGVSFIALPPEVSVPATFALTFATLWWFLK